MTSGTAKLSMEEDWIIPAKDNHPKIVNMESPIDIMPIFVPASSIIPFCPELQYAEQKSSKPIEIRIYEVSDGISQLYEDENDNYDYQKGIYSIIPFSWDNSTKTLTIGKRIGEFSGMLEERIFNIVLVNGTHGSGINSTGKPDAIVKYNGDEISIKL